MKKLTSLLLTAIIIFSLSTTALAANQTFSDVPADHWANEQISTLVENNIVSGYTDGTFKPNNSITRAEWAKLLVSSAEVDLRFDGWQGMNYTGGTDIDNNAWYGKYMTTLMYYFSSEKTVHEKYYIDGDYTAYPDFNTNPMTYEEYLKREQKELDIIEKYGFVDAYVEETMHTDKYFDKNGNHIHEMIEKYQEDRDALIYEISGWRNDYVTATRYYPLSHATRTDVVVSLVKVKGYVVSDADVSILNKFIDKDSIPSELQPYIAIAVEKGIISGFPNGSFGGDKTITRCEASVVLWRAFYDTKYSVLDNINDVNDVNKMYENDAIGDGIHNSPYSVSSFFDEYSEHKHNFSDNLFRQEGDYILYE